MNSRLPRALILLAVATGLVLQVPVIHAQVSGPAAVWWDTGVWNNRYPGSNVMVSVHIYDSAQINQSATIKSLNLTTPWQTYSAGALPVTLCEGCTYLYQFNVTIPATQATGNVDFQVAFGGTYSTGSALCASKANVCSETVPVTIEANPTTLQSKVNTYADVYLPVGIIIPSLLAVIFLAMYVRKKGP